jgi:hypothetical protein
MMRQNHLPPLLVLCVAFLLAGCDEAPRSAAPVASGTLITGTLWEKPVASPGETGSNSGSSPAEGSRVEVYENFIIVTDPEGNATLSPHGWYTNLSFARE